MISGFEKRVRVTDLYSSFQIYQCSKKKKLCYIPLLMKYKTFDIFLKNSDALTFVIAKCVYKIIAIAPGMIFFTAMLFGTIALRNLLKSLHFFFC